MNGVNSVQIITEMDFLRFDACACDSSVATAPSQSPFKDGSSRQKTLTLPSFTFFFIKSHVSEANTSYVFSSKDRKFRILDFWQENSNPQQRGRFSLKDN